MAELTREIVERKPDETAVIDGSGSYTWAQMDARTNRLIHGLRELGLTTEDRIAILSGNRHEYVEVNSAAFNGGWVLVPVNWHLTADEVAYILEDSGSRVLVADPDFTETAVEAASRAGVETKVMLSGGTAEGSLDYEELLEAQPPDEPAGQLSGANMFYTSGTTGRPKGVRSTALPPGGAVETLRGTIEGLAGLVRIIPEAKMFVNSPLYHAGPYAWTMVSAALGSSVVMRRRFDPAESLELMDEHGIEQAYFVPTHFVRFLRLPESTKESFRGDSLKAVFHTGAPCPVDVKQRMIEWWGPVFFDYYGATEGLGSGTVIGSDEWMEKPGSVGKPLPTCELLILDEEGSRLGPGEVGQIYFRSLLGADFEYAGAPEKTEDVHLEPGVYTYGDVGYVDEDGYLFLADRKIDMIVSGGVNVYPAEIEAVLLGHPAVSDAAVFGVPNEEFGEEVKAAVQLAPGREAEAELTGELKRFCREKLAGYKVPRTVDFVEDFPRTDTGKLQKRLLRDPYWEGRERAI